MKQQDTYKEPKTIEFENMVVRVHRPILTEAEQKRRMKQIYKSAETLLKEVVI